MTALLVPGVGAASSVARAQAAGADSAAARAPDSLRAIVVDDSLGIPGTLRGRSDAMDPEQVKEMLRRMGSSEVAGRTEWERKKNPRVAMLCSALLPGLGQTYNGRRLKVGLMAGATTFYFGNSWLNWRRYQASIARRDTLVPGTVAFNSENARAEIWKEDARAFLWWSGAVWLIGILDSWIDAHLYDVRAYTPPARLESSALPTDWGPGSYVTLGFDIGW